MPWQSFVVLFGGAGALAASSIAAKFGVVLPHTVELVIHWLPWFLIAAVELAR